MMDEETDLKLLEIMLELLLTLEVWVDIVLELAAFEIGVVVLNKKLVAVLLELLPQLMHDFEVCVDI